MRKLAQLTIVAFALLASCGGGGGGATFDMMYLAPGGSGLSDGQLARLPFAPLLTRDVTLSPGVDVSGHVTDGSGAALAGVEISFRPSVTGPEMASATTDALGDYATSIGAGRWVAVLRAPSDALGTRTEEGLVVSTPGPVTLDFAYPAAFAVSGRVLDSLGAGLDGAGVVFRGARTGTRVERSTDGTGSYSASLLPDTYEAIVTPEGAAALTHLRQRFPGIVVTDTPVARDFTLVRGVQVSGFVLSDLGLPLPEKSDVRVLLPESSPFFPPDRVETDQTTGAYSIGPVPTGNVSFLIEPAGDSGFPAQKFTRLIAGPVTESEDFILTLGVLLSGRVFRNDGTTPEGNVLIEAVPLDNVPAPEDTRTDGTGDYDLSLFPGRYELHITPEPGNFQLPEVRIVSVSATMTLDIVLVSGVPVTGTILLPDGVTPAANIRVAIDGVLGASDVTNGAGDYAFLAPAGVHTFTLVAEKGPLHDMALAPVPNVLLMLPGPVVQDVTLALATTGRTVVTGTVYAPDATTPVAGVEIMATDAVGDTLGRALTDAAGGYRLVIP